ncbi:MAG: FAD-dependent oxidoreductase [Candidatus Marinimicrobia bacterium]|nr:FAD-dependent oxidoreductase [Candidatus Neomarinimicrobiota bacterium]
MTIMRSDTLHPIPAEQLFASVLYSLKTGSVFGIYRSLFFQPEKNRELQTSVFGHSLDTPVGPAAGPHTQMAQNIIAGWLCGARYIELKTVQTLDEIEVDKPCIDISDEGYNCEWSQELKIEQSFEEYLKAWIIIHILQHELNYPEPFGTVFNMSVGYDMKGIRQDNMQRFFEKMRDCSKEKARMIDIIRPLYPAIDKISIPDTVSDNVTLSTMHGCPAGEIETIGRYLLKEKGLHTFIKLNPTLLGKKAINSILHSLGFETVVPDVAFEHDIDFLSACELIRALQKTSLGEKLFFGVKLTNTLESKNNKDIFTPENMYMSGKALHPVSINTAAKLRNEFPDLPLSFCGGVNAGNISDVLNAGMHPVTVCSDLLQPGGYTKLLQYLENIAAGRTENDPAAFLKRYAEKVKTDKHYTHEYKTIKTERTLKEFDCISAPCVDTCPAHQNIPAYLNYIYGGENEKALETILHTNPFPSSTGMICDHSCQSKCTRINYDSAVRIRDIKRYIAENSETMTPPVSGRLSDKRIAVIGAGPSGLSCAYYLALAGCRVDVYEKKELPGGMLAGAIPEFRLSRKALKNDISLIENAGVNIHISQLITKDGFRELKNNSDYLYIAVGAQKAIKGDIPGMEGVAGVLDPLEFLSLVRERRIPDIGKNILVLGGGNTAVDVARTARRIAGKDSSVSIVYRRSRKEIPADADEIKAAANENITLIERAAPARVIFEDGRITALECHRMRLVEEENSERPKPVIIPGKEFSIPADTVIPAFGQSIDADFLDEKLLQGEKDRETRMKNVFIGGDAYRGASFLIRSIADGKEVAEEILRRAEAWLPEKALADRNPSSRGRASP